MKKIMILAALAAAVTVAFAAEHDTPQLSGEYTRLPAGEKVYAGNIAAVWTNGMAYAVNSATPSTGTLTVIGVFQHSAAKGEKVLAKRGGFVLENAGNVTKMEIGATAYSVSSNAWTVSKTSGTKAVGKVADVRDDGKVAVVIGL